MKLLQTSVGFVPRFVKGIFDGADLNELFDGSGSLYGVQQNAEGGLRTIGKWNEKVAEFPMARAGEPWDGYPLYPLIGEVQVASEVV